MTVIDGFLSRYARELDFYREAARLCAQQCERELEQNGIRAIVTHRAKRPERLRDKICARNVNATYTTEEDVRADIIDLAGVRIALYFPGDLAEVERLIESSFEVQQRKRFPEDSDTPAYRKRFSGYAARHYRVAIRPTSLSDTEARYADARIEIQVASVLIHAWAEVEHDLVYKPLSGKLSEDEYAILDELNGLVLAGEIALERLQRAGELRVAIGEERFANHYDLASYIYGRVTNAP